MNRVGDSLFCTGSNEELVRALTSADAEFVVIGGLAISWFCTERAADDMDLLLNPTLDNSVRIANALGTLHLTGFDQMSFTKSGLQVPLKGRHYAELLTPRTDGPSYQDVAGDAIPAKLFNIPVCVASVRGLLRLKEHALASSTIESSKHAADIRMLRAYAV